MLKANTSVFSVSSASECSSLGPFKSAAVSDLLKKLFFYLQASGIIIISFYGVKVNDAAAAQGSVF